MEKTKLQVIDIDLIKAVMEERGMDEKELAKRMGVTPPTVKRLLNGADQRYMSSSVVFRLSMALDMPAQCMLKI